MVTGLSVNDRINVPRAIRKRLRAAVHARSVGRKPTWNGKPARASQLRGLASFVMSANKPAGKALMKAMSKAKP